VYFCWKCQSRYAVHQVWCNVCMDGGTVIVEPMRPSASMRTEFQSATARDLVKRQWSMVESEAYPNLLVGKGALIGVWGQPGSGKSTWATRFVDKLSGAVVYLSAEEKLGPTVAARLERCGVTRAGFHVVGQGSLDDLCEKCRVIGAVALVIDSIAMTTVQPSDLRRLLESAQVAVLVYVMHATKEGQAAGSNAYLHEADVVVCVEQMVWSLDKSRYQQAAGSYSVLASSR